MPSYIYLPENNAPRMTQTLLLFHFPRIVTFISPDVQQLKLKMMWNHIIPKTLTELPPTFQNGLWSTG